MALIDKPRPHSLLRRFLPGDAPATALAVVLDAFVVGAALLAALLLRFDSDIPRENWLFTLRIFPLIAILYIAANVALGVYRTVWTYAGVADLLNLSRGIFGVTVLIFAVNFVFPDRDLPLSVVLITGILVFPGMAAVKMRGRIFAVIPWGGSSARRLLIVGAGKTGQTFARTLQNDPSLGYQPVGFVDVDPRAVHARIQGLRVLGTVEELDSIIVRRDVDMVAIALPDASGSQVRALLAVCEARLVPVRVVPAIEEWAHARTAEPLRSITLDDLLDRDPVEIDYNACAETVAGRSVMVTGAAGSIGSELCRQLLRFGPRELHMLDNNETGLHDLHLALGPDASDTVLRTWIANVADEPRIESVFAASRPDVVFHAAALKHVPLMEDHPGEAFRVNVLGTRNVALAARTFQASAFILISTDKAVAPSSVMGATKRIAELQVLALSGTSEHTRYAAVRFVNVMGSRGSVVFTFLKQIERGGPVTVMHPEMMRYFISISEAVSLVIQAGTFAGQGDIFMLDMGEEVRILDLAERMIRLRGLRPGTDIDVVFTGPRPGEKLREDLVGDFERMERTAHPNVRRLTAGVPVAEDEMTRLIGELRRIMWDDPEEIRQRLHLVARAYSREPSIEDGPAAGESLKQTS